MSGLRTMIFGRRNRIGRRLIVRIIAFSSLITLLISIIQLAFEYRELRGELDRQLDSISIHVPNIAGNVWNFDEIQIQLALDALRQLPNIDHVSVTTAPDHKQWVAGENRSRDTVTRRYALRHQAKGELAEIGQLDVVASLSAIYGQVAARALTIVISNGLKTFLVALFMVFLFRRLVTRRLENMLRKVEQLSPDMLPSREAPTQHEPLDELQAVEWTLDKSARHLGSAVAALNRVNLELEQRVAEQAALLQNALVGIVMVRHREIVTCNRRFEEIFGYDSGAMTGRSSDILYLSDDELARIGDHALGAFAHGMSFSHTLLMRKRDGSSIWVEIAGRAIDNDKPREGSIWIFTDVSEHKKAQESIEFIAYHDALTELPNRRLAQDRFHQAVAFSERVQSRIAVLCLDLDNFKTINDSLGHGIGDRLIQQVATRLLQCVRDTDTVCRQGGDEFIIVLSNIAEPDATAPILVKLMEGLLDPYDIDGHELNTTVSVGVAIYPDDGPDFDTLLKKADMAMYRAKDAGRNTYRFFDPQMNVDAVEQLRMRNGLRRALERHEFVLHYQPQINLASGELVGVEALIRWRHPELGMVPPARFIPVAEESGLIVVIGEWVLREACRQAALWHQAGLADLVIAVNLSALQFKRGDLEQSVVAALEESGIKPSLLELELTESILISNIESVLATVKRLKALGVKLSIDDFGTGYSSLSYLKRFEVDRLKIDQSFVRDLASNAEDAAIVHAIIRMAHSLGLTTIAEGVEDAAALARLRVFGCDLAQGYFFARPMPAEELMSYLDKAALVLA
jgi:diguanylate cyclase (GGDEF)-like protein/PAS domain S-box-containing protein